MEGVQRWMHGARRATAAYPRQDGALGLFIGFIVAVAAVFAGALLMI
jgi:hypothetical protein